MLKNHLSGKILMFRSVGLTDKQVIMPKFPFLLPPYSYTSKFLIQVRLFHKVFKRIDVDKSNSITVDEFFSYFKYMPSTPTNMLKWTVGACVKHFYAHIHSLAMNAICRYQFLTPLCKRLFMIFDEDKSGDLNFTVNKRFCDFSSSSYLPSKTSCHCANRFRHPYIAGVRDMHMELRITHRGS